MSFLPKEMFQHLKSLRIKFPEYYTIQCRKPLCFMEIVMDVDIYCLLITVVPIFVSWSNLEKCAMFQLIL